MERRFELSMRYMDRARSVIPRGVTSARRVDRDPTPLVFNAAQGSRLTDVDGNEYIDYVAGMGPMLLGHQNAAVGDAVHRASAHGVLYGGQHLGELELAQRLIRCVPSAERVLVCSTGSEAVAAAIRVARAATGRAKIVKFEGHYHGWLEPVAVNMPGTTPSAHRDDTPLPELGLPTPANIVVVPWNDRDALDALLSRMSGSIAAVIMEPLACNAGNLYSDSGYLHHVRELCSAMGVLLIFDEVITGFRLGLGGAQATFGVHPDITVLGKAIASGYPLAAVVGRADVLDIAAGSLAHVGTYNGNVVSVAAANGTLEVLETGGKALYDRLDRIAARLGDGLKEAAASRDIPLQVIRAGSILRLVWAGPEPIRTYADIQCSDRASVKDLATLLQLDGVHVLGRGLWYVSVAHSERDIDETVAAVARALPQVGRTAAPAVR